MGIGFAERERRQGTLQGTLPSNVAKAADDEKRRMLDKTDDISVAADNWLVQFEDALASPDDVLLKPLFHPDSYWRDVLALSWNIQTVNRAFAILGELPAHARRSAPYNFRIDADRAAPRRVMRAGTHAIEAIFRFETAVGRGHGIVRLVPDEADDNSLKAWTL